MSEHRAPAPHRRIRRIRALRTIVAIAVLVAAAIGTATNTDLGTLCAWCPLGLAQASAAARTFLPAIVVPLVAVAAAALIAGRAFCAWGCPSNLVKKRSARREAARTPSHGEALRQLLLVGGVLMVSFVVGFPVFCLICPIGLAFGFLFAVFKSLTIYQPSWDLVIMPLMLLVEFRLLKSWCRTICPIGAALGLIAHISPRRLSVRADSRRCQEPAGCHACGDACEEGIPARRIGKTIDSGCTLCLECTGVCPHGALQPRVGIGTKNREEEQNESI